MMPSSQNDLEEAAHPLRRDWIPERWLRSSECSSPPFVFVPRYLVKVHALKMCGPCEESNELSRSLPAINGVSIWLGY